VLKGAVIVVTDEVKQTGSRTGAIVVGLFALLASRGIEASAVRIELEVDATDVVRGIQHVQLTLPARAGMLTLAYPKWIPGEHLPTGPITQLMNLHIEAGGRSVSWRRDVRDPFLFRMALPNGASTVKVHFDFFSPPRAFGSGFGETPDVTMRLIVLAFNQLILYPAEMPASAIDVKTRVRIPNGWRLDCALRIDAVSKGEFSLPLVPLYTLVDSPLMAGKYFRSIPLGGEGTAIRLSIAADQPGDLAVNEGMIHAMRRVVEETTALFGPAHYRTYTWLVALGDRLGHDGLEHHESADVREVDRFFTDPAYAIDWRLFPHEFVHSWNGKYRRPVGLTTRNYQQPMIDDLLWVYEGLTRYYGDFVLSSRSGLATPQQTRAYLAYVAALIDRTRVGRDWRSVADTAIAYPGYSQAPTEWQSVRRGSDFYGEMLLVWLEADTLIRDQTHGARSLDDFCRGFFAGPPGKPAVKPYTRAEVIGTLEAVTRLDWNSFFEARVDSVDPRTPLAGIEAAGWQLSYGDTPNEFLTALERTTSVDDFSLSLGMWVKGDGTVADVVPGSPAYAAGIAPAMRLIAVDGHTWKTDEARALIVRAERSSQPLELEVAFGDEIRSLSIDYHGGLQYPYLRREAGKPDLLGAILAARADPAF
jgi:predicted metalloprotease with PDZ domain